MTNPALQICRIYEDFLAAVVETFGERPFTLQNLKDKGIEFPGRRTLLFFWRRGALDLHRRGRPNSWRVAPACREYLRRRAAP